MKIRLGKYAIHMVAAAILVIALAALPEHLRAAGTQWLYDQAMAVCGPTGIFPIFSGND